jgi:hypothetical protein
MIADQMRVSLVHPDALRVPYCDPAEVLSRITLSDGLLIAEFNGLPSSASQVL